MFIKQISVFVSNTAGGLAEITDMLAENSIDIRALSIADTADFGILRLIVDDCDKAQKLLRESGMVITVTDVLAAHLNDQPGGLAAILRILADASISVEYLYAFVTRNPENACVVFRVPDNEEASRVLEAKGVKLATAEEINSMLD